ncbi:WRKY Transcription Factor [Balamuthia mandrillaris]
MGTVSSHSQSTSAAATNSAPSSSYSAPVISSRFPLDTQQTPRSLIDAAADIDRGGEKLPPAAAASKEVSSPRLTTTTPANKSSISSILQSKDEESEEDETDSEEGEEEAKVVESRGSISTTQKFSSKSLQQGEANNNNNNRTLIDGERPSSSLSTRVNHAVSSTSEEGRNTESKGEAASEDDGFRWRKYGRKSVKGSQFPRSYYKCTHPGCQVKKQVEAVLDKSGKTVYHTTYKGEHSHDMPQVTRLNAQDQLTFKNSVLSEFLGRTDCEGTVGKHKRGSTSTTGSSSRGRNDGDHDEDTNEDEGDRSSEDRNKNRLSTTSAANPRLVIETKVGVDYLDDGYHWRKYGQKNVKGSTNPRSYYKCTEKNCPVKKQVERNGNVIINTYEGKHNHLAPGLDPTARKRRRRKHSPERELQSWTTVEHTTTPQQLSSSSSSSSSTSSTSSSSSSASTSFAPSSFSPTSSNTPSYYRPEASFSSPPQLAGVSALAYAAFHDIDNSPPTSSSSFSRPLAPIAHSATSNPDPFLRNHNPSSSSSVPTLRQVSLPPFSQLAPPPGGGAQLPFFASSSFLPPPVYGSNSMLPPQNPK